MTVACVAAPLLMNICIRNVLEKEQIERIAIQKDVQNLRGQTASHQRSLDSNVEADVAYKELEALSYSISVMICVLQFVQCRIIANGCVQSI